MESENAFHFPFKL